jgi:hypothetical protein
LGNDGRGDSTFDFTNNFAENWNVCFKIGWILRGRITGRT